MSDRWDFDCQKCGRSISLEGLGWYRCSQDIGASEKQEESFLQYLKSRESVSFDKDGEIIEGPLPKDEKQVKVLKAAILECIKEDKKDLEATYSGYEGNVLYVLSVFIDFEKRRAWWVEGDDDSDENYQRAGLIKHKVKGRGRGRFGYCFCTKCAKDLGYKCSLCESELVKISD